LYSGGAVNYNLGRFTAIAWQGTGLKFAIYFMRIFIAMLDALESLHAAQGRHVKLMPTDR
jgi:hypothetical protein